LSRGRTIAFIAGQLSVRADGEVVGSGNFEAQFRRTWRTC